MSTRLLLNKLAERGFIKLPPRQRGGGRRIPRALSEPELFSLSAGAEELIEGPLGALQPLEVITVEPGLSKPRPLFGIWPSIITWASRAPRARTCATSFETVTDATWPACSLPGQPGKSKPVMPSSVGAPAAPGAALANN